MKRVASFPCSEGVVHPRLIDMFLLALLVVLWCVHAVLEAIDNFFKNRRK